MQSSYKGAFTEAKKPNFKRSSRPGRRAEKGGGQDDGRQAYDHVYIDVNNVLHVAAHHTKNEGAFFKKLFALLDLTLRKTSPQYTVTLALDGPAPIAKTITQRRRRIRLSSGEKQPLSQDPPRLLKLGLTPGSILALKIDRALEYYAATRLISRNALPRGLLFEISGTRVPGEGEVKILRSMKTRVKNPLFKHHSHLIVSEDSDALLLAMTAVPANTFVLSSKLVFSVESFNRMLAQQLPRGTCLDSARRDFVALAVMMGNDYLPGSRFGVKYSWRAYTQLRSGDASPLSQPTAGVAWGKYRDTPMFPAHTAEEEDAMRKSGRVRKGRGLPCDNDEVAAVFEEGKLAFRHPPSVNWEMLMDLSKILSDPEYVKCQVNDGLRPRADVQRAVNAAAAAAAMMTDADALRPAEGHGGRQKRAGVAAGDVFDTNCQAVNGVMRAHADPARSTRRAYEYIHGVGWVLEMYYSGACMDYGYHFQYSPQEQNQRLVNTHTGQRLIEVDAEGNKTTLDAEETEKAGEGPAMTGTGANEASKRNNETSAVHGATSRFNARGGRGRTTIPPPAVDLADFLTLPLSYDPTMDPLRDQSRASTAYLNRYPITPLAYSLAVIPRGGRSMLAPGVRPLVDPGSPVRHLFKDDYCVTCIKHRIAAGPLERTIQEESTPGDAGGGGGRGYNRSNWGRGRGRGRGGRGSRAPPRATGAGNEKQPPGKANQSPSLSRKFAGGDESIRMAAAQGGDAAREMLRVLNRRHLGHLAQAPQHASDNPPPPLNALEGAVARMSIDAALSAEEETLRTLGDQPVLIWHHYSCDPPDLDREALTTEEELPEWAASVAPPGCRSIGRQIQEIRRYDGDAGRVVSAWRVGGEPPAVATGPGGRGGGGHNPNHKSGNDGERNRGGSGRRGGRGRRRGGFGSSFVRSRNGLGLGDGANEKGLAPSGGGGGGGGSGATPPSSQSPSSRGRWRRQQQWSEPPASPGGEATEAKPSPPKAREDGDARMSMDEAGGAGGEIKRGAGGSLGGINGRKNGDGGKLARRRRDAAEVEPSGGSDQPPRVDGSAGGRGRRARTNALPSLGGQCWRRGGQGGQGPFGRLTDPYATRGRGRGAVRAALRGALSTRLVAAF